MDKEVISVAIADAMTKARYDLGNNTPPDAVMMYLAGLINKRLDLRLVFDAGRPRELGEAEGPGFRTAAWRNLDG